MSGLCFFNQSDSTDNQLLSVDSDLNIDKKETDTCISANNSLAILASLNVVHVKKREKRGEGLS